MRPLKELWGRPLACAVFLVSLAAACSDSDECKDGAANCACAAGAQCNVGLSCAVDGICRNPAEETGRAPSTPVCYTPCRQSFTDAQGNVVECSPEGLMRRCLDGAECVKGTCVPKERPAPTEVPASTSAPSNTNTVPNTSIAALAPERRDVGTCEKNIDCPDFQVCLEGRCYSNCESDADCPDPKSCYRKSCRLPCEASDETCPDTTYCSLTDAVSGYCLPLEARTEAGVRNVEGTFQVTQDVFAFSNTSLVQSFTIVNDAPMALEFVVSKLDHTEYSAAGQSYISEQSMPWLSIGAEGKAEKVGSFKVLVDGSGGQAVVEIANDPEGIPPKWDGTLKVSSQALGERTLRLSYAQGADGRWAGTVSYFAQFGDTNLNPWAQAREDQGRLGAVGNAFVQRWGAFRLGRISMDEFDAMLTATTTGSWAWPSVREICPTAACYLYTNPQGFGRYSDSLNDQPIPSGVAQLPLAFDLKTLDARHLGGRIVSSEALQYAGDPAITLDFATDPSGCSGANTSACIVPVERLAADVVVGGRFNTLSTNRGCSSQQGFALTQAPWLIPGFLAGTELDPLSQVPYTYECRDRVQPFGMSGATLIALNSSLAGSNPVRDGRSRRRKLELVDGLLVNQSVLYLLLRETFDADFLGAGAGGGFSAYAVAVLHRVNAQLDAQAFEGRQQTEERAGSADLGAPIACTRELVETALGPGSALGAASADDLAGTLLDGIVPGPAPEAIPAGSVHYLCHDNGLFDQGADPNAPAECPVGSGVTFFTGTTVDVTRLACQASGTCQGVLDAWRADPAGAVEVIRVVACDTEDEVLCDADRLNLRSHKVFYLPGDPRAAFAPLTAAINSAFRYKTQFRNRQGRNVGFAPQICVPDSNAVPYCYDPPAIEGIRARVDCLNYLFRSSSGSARSFSLPDATRARLHLFLERSYSYEEERDPDLPIPITHDGFERLNAQLLIMLGDEAYTDAFKSRFELDQSSLVSFEGSKLEAGGIDLAGVAGYEMYTLYQAVQYYQTALDRFFALSSFVWGAVSGDQADNFIQHKTVVSYLDRVMRASTQKSRAWSEVAKRYQSFGRADLARFVIQRAFTAAYIESVSLSRLMQSVVATVTPEQRAQVRKAIDDGALIYQAAFAAMQEQYAGISDETGYFGFAPDYVPFPALEPGGPNAFEALMTNANQASAIAAQKEDLAIYADRGFETDSASFQSELARVRNTYENQLTEICGGFTGSDGVVHPAIRTYAYLDEKAKLLGDPCGMLGNGGLHDAIGEVELVKLDLLGASQAFERVVAEVEIEQRHTAEICQLITDLADFEYETAGSVDDLKSDIARTRKSIEEMKLKLDIIQQATNLMSCIAGTANDCQSKAAASVFWGIASAMVAITASIQEGRILGQQEEIAALERATIKYKGENQCEQVQVNSLAAIERLWLNLKDVRLQALKTGYQLKLALANVQKLRNQASRLVAEQEESQQLTINIEAAKNDPNVRIYKNDAILNADRTFEAAIRATYQATRVYEYYTSQSYAHKGELSLVRLISRGDFSLEGYLLDLERAYATFEESYGNPDTRVDILSLRDDVMQIPRVSDTGAALSESARVVLFRTALNDTRLLDARGYLTVPFSTDFTRLSPVTRNHKVAHVEAEVVGARVGDTLGRVYLRQSGTGAIASVNGSKGYYRFPERTAVVNPFFNGVRVFAPEVYRNEHLRDRPYVNTRWDFVLNQRDERANEDIDLSALTDIRLLVYYTDFTGL